MSNLNPTCHVVVASLLAGEGPGSWWERNAVNLQQQFPATPVPLQKFDFVRFAAWCGNNGLPLSGAGDMTLLLTLCDERGVGRVDTERKTVYRLLPLSQEATNERTN